MRRIVLIYLALLPLVANALPKGGSIAPARPAFLEIDPTSLPNFLSMAKDRHGDAVKAAVEAYWSCDGDGDAIFAAKIDSIQVETHTLSPPSGWSLPDFADEFQNEIKVTSGASGETGASTTPLFTPPECQQVIDAAEAHFEGESWSTLPSGQYDVAGFWIKSVPAVHEWFNRMVSQRLFPLLQREFPNFCSSISQLVVDNAYVFKYTSETGRRTGVHTDSGCLSFTIALGGDYEGGGTWIEGVGTIAMQPGHVTVRPGGVRHCGQAITSGTRYIIGGFCMHRGKVENARMLIGLGAELAGKGQIEKAKEALEAAILINPHFDGAYTHLATAYQKLNKPEKARQVLEHCLHEVNPGNSEVAFTLGMHYFDQDQFDEADKCLDICLQIDEFDVESMMVKAQICSKRGKTEEECKWYERIVATPGASKITTASAYSNLGGMKEGQEEEIEMYKKALELVPDNFQLRYSLGAAYGARKDWAAAAESFRLTAKLTSEEDPDMQSKTLRLLYKVAVQQVQQDNPNGFKSQDEMVQALQHVMGERNYKQLAGGR
jgi:tetratricopeptide (TPR) repeat protein